MFRSTRANARRISLLASSSFLASTLMAGAGGMALTAMTPVIALANPVCNTGAPDGTYAAPAPSAGTFTCGPGPAASLGFTSATGTNLYTSGNLVVNAGGLKVVSTGAGIIVIEQSPVTVTSGGSINATGSGQDGIYAKSAGGNVTVINGTTATPFAVTGDSTGIYAATTGAAAVSVTAASDVTSNAGAGIVALSGTGSVSVTVNSGVTVKTDVPATFYGIVAATGGAGAATVTVHGSTVGTIEAATGTGVAKVVADGTLSDTSAFSVVKVVGGQAVFDQTSGTVTETGTGAGVLMTAGASGASFYSAAGTSISGGSAGDGVNITSTGGITGTAKGTISGDPGVVLNDASAAGISWTQNAAVTGATGGIISTETGTGATSITTNTGATVSGGTGAGISATNANLGGQGITVTANANVSGAQGIVATGSDNIGKATTVNVSGATVTSTAGVGVEAFNNTYALDSRSTAVVNLSGGASVNATGGSGVLAITYGSNVIAPNGVGATVTVTGSGGAVTATGAAGLIGIGAIGGKVGGFYGPAALVDLSSNTGLTVTVGADNNNNDIGVLARTNTIGEENATVKLGGTQTVTVGDAILATATGIVGVAAQIPNALNAGATASVLGAASDYVHVYGHGAVGVEATAGVENVNITLVSGAVTVLDPFVDNTSIGLLAATGGAGTVTIKAGTTNVSNNNGTGIEALGHDGAIYVSTQGNVYSSFGGGDAIYALSTGKGDITVTDGASAPTSAHIEATDNSNQSGIVALATGTGGITVNFHGSIGQDSTVSNVGIEAEILNVTNTKSITINAGNIHSYNQGIFAEIVPNVGVGGNINITTDPGTNITSEHSDGIDAFNFGGGNVNITLLDGSISALNSNGSGAGGGGTGTGLPLPTLDPHAIHSIVVGNGYANLDLQSNLINVGPGAAVLSGSYNGVNFVHLDNVGSYPYIHQTNAGSGIYVYSTGSVLVAGTGPVAGKTGLYVLADAGTDIEANDGNGITAIAKGTGAVSAGVNIVTVIDHGDIGYYSAVGYSGIVAEIVYGQSGGIYVQGANINATDYGIIAVTNGAGNVFVGTDAGTTITAINDTGIIAENFAAPGVPTASGSVTVNALGNIGTSAKYGSVGGDGIFARIAGSDNTSPISVSSQANIFSYYSGIVSVTYGLGTNTVNFGTTSTGTITLQAQDDPGILARSFNGSNTSSVVVNVGSANTGSVTVHALYGDGVVAINDGSGNTSVTIGKNGHVISDVFDGVYAFGGTGNVAIGAGDGVTITVNGSVSAPLGEGLDLVSGNNVTISTGVGSSISGLGDAIPALGGTSLYTHAVVKVFAPAGATTTLNNLGTITSASASAHSFGDLAVLETVGTVAINNGGAIDGRMWFGGLTGTSSVTIQNGVSDGVNFGNGLWQFSGTSLLSSNDDSITNGASNITTGTAKGVIATADNGLLTTLDFGDGDDSLNNTASGVIVAGEGSIPGATAAGAEPTPAVTLINNLETFTNNGLIVLGGSAGSTKSDGKIDSVLDSTGSSATLTGSGIVALDANLWSDVQVGTDCTTYALKAADCLVVPATAGNEGLRVTDTKGHAFGAFNPTGIAIVSGSSAAGTFHMDSGSSYFTAGGTGEFGGATNVLDKPGLFFYDLAFDGTDHTERLIGVPKAAAFEFASVAGAVNDVWYATTQTWFDRQADLRDGIEGRMTGGKPGVWLKAMGDWSRRSHTDVFTDFNKTYVFNVSYDQDTAALIGGVDFLDVTNKDQAWVLGVEGGAVDSNIRFRFSADRFHLNGTDFGGYATYISGPLFVDATINANFLTLDSSLPLNTNPNPWTASSHVTTVGGQVESGYEVPLGSMAFVEPLGTLSYVSDSLGNVAVPGGTVTIGHDDSFRGSLGARIGASAAYQYYKVKVALTGRVWDEFNNRPATVVIVAGGPNFPNSDSLTGVFGEVSGQANLFSTTSGFSAFVSGGVKFKSSYTEGTATLGARYQW